MPHSKPAWQASTFAFSPCKFSYKLDTISSISEFTFGCQPGYSPESSTLKPDNSKADFNEFAKSILLVSDDERVKHSILIWPDFAITLAILLDVSTKFSISGLILYTPLKAA